MNEIPKVSLEEVQQPTCVELHTVDGVHITQFMLEQKNVIMPQHSHEHDHMTMVAVGSVKVWGDGMYLGQYNAPTGIEIKAGVKHTMLCTEPKTILYCIHNTMRTGEIEVREEHTLEVA